MSRPKSHKRDREKARDERAAAKAVRRTDRRNSVADGPQPLSEDEQSRLLAELAELHRRFADDEIEFEEFDAAKHELSQRLDVQ